MRSQKWNRASATVDGIKDHKLSYLAPAGQGWNSILLQLNSSIAEALPKSISESDAGDAVVFYEYDRAAWGYALYRDGKEIDRFCNRPEKPGLPHSKTKGYATRLAEVFRVDAKKIEPYLQHLTKHDSGARQKAFPDDEFPLANPWVRIDFMRRLGIRYPNPGRTRGGKYILVNEPHAARAEKQKALPLAKKEAAKWWQFWKRIPFLKAGSK